METLEIDPLTKFFSAIKNPTTKDRCEGRLKLFFQYLKLEGYLSEQAKTFSKKAKQDPQWATYIINEYMRGHDKRAEKKRD
jgi:hypothetical protein